MIMCNKLLCYYGSLDSTLLKTRDREWLEGILTSYSGEELSINIMWNLLDKIWIELKCDPLVDDLRISKFYQHPVWLLNGMHIETNEQSIKNRREFTNWVKCFRPKRIADFGGGFGSLGRMIGAECVECSVEIVEPYPFSVAEDLCEQFENVSYVPTLTGTYDLIIATDVFEHVDDPIGLLSKTCQHLRKGSRYLIGNCFEPVILCHLPQTFHFGGSWATVLNSMGLKPVSKIAYAMAYEYTGEVNIQSARRYEQFSKYFYSILNPLPRGLEKKILETFVHFVIKYDLLLNRHRA